VCLSFICILPFPSSLSLSVFLFFSGHALDERTPLLRAQEAINEHGTRLMRALGDKRTTQEGYKMVSNVGWEQEFFVVSKENFLQRPDLMNTGRTLLGALPARAQQTEYNYFNAVPPRVQAMLREAQTEMLAVGIAVNTTHNEVAPGQHEICPIFTLTNIAADQNVLARRIMDETAAKHGLSILFHEKPFAKINGTGKHNNWGLNLSTGDNLFTAGKTVEEQTRFMAMMACMTRGIDLHGDVIRVGVAHAGNDHRLGAQEAPPAIISLYTGTTMEKHIDGIIAGGPLPGYGAQSIELPFGTKSVVPVAKPIEDRNRTAPLPFCGNRFELRAVGGSQNIAFPMALLNTVIADSMLHVAQQIESGKSIQTVVTETFKKHRRSIFNGNGYSAEWQTEAAKRGIPNLKNTVDALATFDSAKNRALFGAMKVFTPEELEARTHIMQEQYVHVIKLEANCQLDMLKTGILPAVLEDQRGAAESIARAEAVLKRTDAVSPSQAFLAEKNAYLNTLMSETAALDAAINGCPDDDKAPRYCLETIKPAMDRYNSVLLLIRLSWRLCHVVRSLDPSLFPSGVFFSIPSV
jgi:glutamine synthetase